MIGFVSLYPGCDIERYGFRGRILVVAIRSLKIGDQLRTIVCCGSRSRRFSSSFCGPVRAEHLVSTNVLHRLEECSHPARRIRYSALPEFNRTFRGLGASHSGFRPNCFTLPRQEFFQPTTLSTQTLLSTYFAIRPPVSDAKLSISSGSCSMFHLGVVSA